MLWSAYLPGASHPLVKNVTTPKGYMYQTQAERMTSWKLLKKINKINWNPELWSQNFSFLSTDKLFSATCLYVICSTLKSVSSFMERCKNGQCNLQHALAGIQIIWQFGKSVQYTYYIYIRWLKKYLKMVINEQFYRF